MADEAILRTYLAQRDVPCPVCAYNLRGSEGPKCPECGARLDLRVGSIDLRLGPWLLCVLAVAVPLGFSGILAVLALIAARRSPSWRVDDWILLGAMWAFAIICAGLLTWVVRRRARLLRRSSRGQWVRAWSWAAFMLVFQAGMIWLMLRIL